MTLFVWLQWSWSCTIQVSNCWDTQHTIHITTYNNGVKTNTSAETRITRNNQILKDEIKPCVQIGAVQYVCRRLTKQQPKCKKKKESHYVACRRWMASAFCARFEYKALNKLRMNCGYTWMMGGMDMGKGGREGRKGRDNIMSESTRQLHVFNYHTKTDACELF